MTKTVRYTPKNYSLEDYDASRAEITLRLSYFFTPYLFEISHLFKGDLHSCILLAEIAHHSTSRYFSHHRIDSPALRTLDLRDLSKASYKFNTCNAFSLSAATGIPRETVRRKIEKLISRKLIVRTPTKELKISAQVAELMNPDFQRRQLDGLIETVRAIETLLAANAAARKKAAKSSG